MGDFTEYLGIRTVSSEAGLCIMECDLEDRHMSTADRVHGGVFFTMLDTAMGRSVISKLPDGRGCATLEAKINYFRPVQEGRLRAEARVLTMTRNTAFVEATLSDAEERIVCRASATFMLTESRTQQDRERV
jgi:acyl-CoA thioesterase